MVVLEGTGQDLAGAGAVVVDQDVERHPPLGRAVGCQRLGLPLGSAAGRDDQALVDEPLGDLDGHVEQAAGIAPEVEHQGPHALAGKGARRRGRSPRPRFSGSR